MQAHYTICMLLIIGIPTISCSDSDDLLRNQKLISSFQIVKFPNDPCVGSADRNGTCYTSQECADKSGTSSGSCADGFGVCCTFVITNCGSTTSENNTAWTTPTNLPNTATTCGLTVCPASTEICSLRLDFTTFVITGPSLDANNGVRRQFGTPVGDMGDLALAAQGTSFATNCRLDIFTATSASTSTNPPAVCGTLTTEHMYVEADTDRCNVLQFNLAASGTPLPAIANTNARGVAAFADRNWDITVSQIECSSAVLPPVGCTKYYFTPTASAQLFSYNFQAGAGTTHLAGQHERFCIRRERGNCIGCFSAAAVANVQLSGNAGTPTVFTQAGGCCGYHTQASTGSSGLLLGAEPEGAAGEAGGAGNFIGTSTQQGFDCVIIPGAFVSVGDANGTPVVAGNNAASVTQLQNRVINPAVTGNVPAPPQICGNHQGLGIGAATLLSAAYDHGARIANAALAAGNAGTQMAGGNVNLSICTRSAPFTLEFMSDDLDGLGTQAGIAENMLANQGANRGFQIEHTQVACSAA